MGGVPSKPDYSKSMLVIGAGLSRTGTVSTQLALEKLLGGPVMHGGTHMISREDGKCACETAAPFVSIVLMKI